MGNRLLRIIMRYDPCQINACERAPNQSRLRETRLVLKLLYGLNVPEIDAALSHSHSQPKIVDHGT